MKLTLAQKNLVAMKSCKDFETTFLLKFKDYWNPMLGFDICKFDEDIKTPDGTSTRDFIIQKYNKDACTLIETLTFL